MKAACSLLKFKCRCDIPSSRPRRASSRPCESQRAGTVDDWVYCLIAYQLYSCFNALICTRCNTFNPCCAATTPTSTAKAASASTSSTCALPPPPSPPPFIHKNIQHLRTFYSHTHKTSLHASQGLLAPRFKHQHFAAVAAAAAC